MKEFIYLKLKWLHSGIQTKINQTNPTAITDKESPTYSIIFLSSNVMKTSLNFDPKKFRLEWL
jgi:hypothetical protein